MTGAELRAHRKAAGLSQTVLAQYAGIGRHAVSYWECKVEIDPQSWAVRRMAEFLQLKLPDYYHHYARARGWGLSGWREVQAHMDALVETKMAQWREREAQRSARCRVVCQATTRKGTSCRNKSEPGKRRCKFHGGKSTGPRTAEGKQRIADAQRQRWREYRNRGIG